MKSRIAVATIAFAILVAGPWLPASAQEAGGTGSNDRFVIEREMDGYLRLDRKTGDLSFCRIKESGLSCVSSAEERAAWAADIARLEDRIERIERELAVRDSQDDADEPENREQDFRSQGPGQEPGSQENGEAEAELDRALDLAEKAWRRFADMIRQMKDDLARRDPAK